MRLQTYRDESLKFLVLAAVIAALVAGAALFVSNKSRLAGARVDIAAQHHGASR
jgi:hypothetical protein